MKCKSIIHTRKEQIFVKFCRYTIENCLLWHILPSEVLLYFEKHDLLQSFFKCGSRVVHNFFN